MTSSGAIAAEAANDLRAIVVALETTCRDNSLVAFACRPEDPFEAIWFTANMKAELGVTVDQYTDGGWKTYVHPDDAEWVLNSDGTSSVTQPTRYRMLNPETRRYFWLESYAEMIFADDGTPTALVGWLRNRGDA